jgi:molybdenum cofactor synthesis domain-containing protein
MKTAQILIIGNEILSGRTQDTNSNYLAKALFVRGVRVQKIEVIPDDTAIIAQWIKTKSQLSDFVFVCGGIGGTPDDVTRLAVAQGVGVELVRHPVAEKILTDHYGDRINADRMNMADLPKGCELIENTVTKAPGFKVKNIYVFAGIPKILHAMFESVEKDFQGTPFIESELNLKVGEGDIAKFMVVLNKEFPTLELGSYPTLDAEKGYKTQLVFRAIDKNVVESAIKRFKTLAGDVCL